MWRKYKTALIIAVIALSFVLLSLYILYKSDLLKKLERLMEKPTEQNTEQNKRYTPIFKALSNWATSSFKIIYICYTLYDGSTEYLFVRNYGGDIESLYVPR